MPMLRPRGLAPLLALLALLALRAVAYAEPATQDIIRPLQKMWMSDKPNGEPITVFPSGVKTLYIVFDYKDAADSQLQLRVYDTKGQIVFSETRKYSGAGRENIEVAFSDPLLDGAYLTNAFIGLQGQMFLTETNEWNVGKAAAPPPEAAPPVAAPTDQVAKSSLPNPGAVNPVVPPPAGQTVDSTDTGLAAPTLVGAGLLVVGLLTLVVWAVRGFLNAPRVSR